MSNCKLSTMRLFQFLRWCLVLFPIKLRQAEDSCVFFTFDDHPVVVKDIIASFHFKVNNTCDDHNTDVRNVNIKLKNDAPPNLLICDIDFLNGSCSGAMGCNYDPQTHAYSVTKLASALSHYQGKWELSGELENGERFHRTLAMNATYLPAIIDLTVKSNGALIDHNEPVEENSEIKLTCVWSEGIPPQKARLKKNGLDLSISEVTFPADKRQYAHHSEHEIGQVKCSDSGEFSCEAPGFKENMKVLLLVKCPPQFGDQASHFPFNHNETLLQFPVFVYSGEVVDCRLRKLDILQGHTRTSECKSTAKWSGLVPNLTLTILLTNATSQLVGEWRLELQNRIGVASVNFSIVSSNTDDPLSLINSVGTTGRWTDTTAERQITNDANGLPRATFRFEFFILLGAVGCVFLLVIILATVFAILFKRRAYQEGWPFALPPPAPHVVRRRLPDSIALRDILLAARDERPRDSFVSVHGHIYNEINDDVTQASNSHASLDASPMSTSFGSSVCLQTIAFASSDSTISEDLHREDSSGCDDSVHLGTSPSSEGALSHSSSYSVARPLQEISLSDYLHPVASEFEVATTLNHDSQFNHAGQKTERHKYEL